MTVKDSEYCLPCEEFNEYWLLPSSCTHWKQEWHFLVSSLPTPVALHVAQYLAIDYNSGFSHLHSGFYPVWMSYLITRTYSPLASLSESLSPENIPSTRVELQLADFPLIWKEQMEGICHFFSLSILSSQNVTTIVYVVIYFKTIFCLPFFSPYSPLIRILSKNINTEHFLGYLFQNYKYKILNFSLLKQQLATVKWLSAWDWETGCPGSSHGFPILFAVRYLTDNAT